MPHCRLFKTFLVTFSSTFLSIALNNRSVVQQPPESGFTLQVKVLQPSDVKSEINALLKVLGFVRALRFLPTGKVDGVVERSSPAVIASHKKW